MNLYCSLNLAAAAALFVAILALGLRFAKGRIRSSAKFPQRREIEIPYGWLASRAWAPARVVLRFRFRVAQFSAPGLEVRAADAAFYLNVAKGYVARLYLKLSTPAPLTRHLWRLGPRPKNYAPGKVETHRDQKGIAY